MSTLEPPARVKNRAVLRHGARFKMKHGRKLVIAMPYMWLILLFLLPFLIVFKISLAEMARAIPPYTNLMDGPTGTDADAESRQLPATDRRSALFEAYLQSLQVAAISTICCLLLGIRWRGRWRTVSHRRVIFCCCW
jgi:putrescine transport system permease protein